MRLEPGDILVMYTDGLVERRGRDIATGISQAQRLLAGWRSEIALAEGCRNSRKRLPRRLAKTTSVLSPCAPGYVPATPPRRLGAYPDRPLRQPQPPRNRPGTPVELLVIQSRPPLPQLDSSRRATRTGSFNPQVLGSSPGGGTSRMYYFG